MERNPRVFCSHRSKDKPKVKEVARELADAGIDPWVDEWEIEPGQDFVAAINRGLESCDAGLIFFSKEVEDGKWVQAEISALTYQAVEQGKPLIPILLDPDVPIPPLLRPRSRLGVEQIDALIDAIYHRTGKPRVASPRADVRRRRVVIRLRKTGPDDVAASAELDGARVAAEATVRLGPGFHFSYADFLRSRPPGSRQAALEHAIADRDHELRDLGRAVGRVLFPDAVDRALNQLLDHATSAGEQVDLILETTDSALFSIPFEAASLENGRIPSLETAVTMFRRLAGSAAQASAPRPGPLKILVAVGAPDEDKTEGAVLDIERELQTILDAIDEAQRYGNASVRVLEVGGVDEVRDALEQQNYHVLHLSGHGKAGAIELEDEDGAPQSATAADLASAIRDSGRPAPLVFLASCHSGAGDTETAGLAHALLQRGIPAVVAMQSAVSDYYSTKLAGAFYAHLCRDERPLASVALARARRELERERRKWVERGERDAGLLAEYATPSLFSAAGEQPLLDRALEIEPLQLPPRMPITGVVPMLRADDLIGRRVELRRLVRVLCDDPRTVAEIGRKSGYQLCGIGGVGKSALAGRAMARLAEHGWIVAAVSGQWSLERLALSVGLALPANPEFAGLAQALARPEMDDKSRLLLLGNLLANCPLLLVLDNFEDNLALSGARFLDAATAQVMEVFYNSAQRGKLLITSRYPLPGSDGWLATEDLGPLSPAQTRKLVLRLAGLRRQEPESLKLVERVIGGHPRALEYLNAILNRGETRMPDVARRLREQAGKLGLDLDRPGVTIQEAIQRALQVAASDILLDELLKIVAANHEVLFQASVFPLPVSASGVASCLGVAGGNLRPALDRLVQSSLLTRLPGDLVWVHRWTAESLRARMSAETFRECCRRGGEYLHTRATQTRSLIDELEAVRLLLSARAYDPAVEIGEGILAFLTEYGRVTDTAIIARELAEGVPEQHPRHWGFVGTEADALRSLGLTGEAEERWRRVTASLENRALEHPDRADYLRDLSVAYERMGDLMRCLGEGDQTRQFYQKLLETTERLVRQEPDRADYLRNLSVSYERMGDLMRDLGEGDQGHQFYQNKLEIAERLVRQEPDRADFLRGLSVAYNKMGDLMRRLGKGEEARQIYQKALEIRERLVQQEPNRADYLRDLSVSYNNMGYLMGSLGEGQQARQFYLKDLEITERLVRQEPDRADYLRDLSVSYERMADLMDSLGEGGEARQFYQKALEIRERLVRQEPDRADYLRDLSDSCERMGDLMRGLGEGTQARQFYQKALEIRERLVRQEPNRADNQTRLAVSLVRAGTRESLKRALAIVRSLEQQGKLTAQQAGWIGIVEQALVKIGS